MKSLLPTTMIFFLLSVSISVFAQNSIEFFEGNLEELFATAKAENKPIFIDAYTNGCIPCKRMETNVFTLPNVSIFYNNFFINYKMDMYSKEGAAFAKKYGVSVYPTYLYLLEDGTLNHKIIGAKDPQKFIEAGRKGAVNRAKLAAMKLQYKAGNRDKEFIEDYLRLLWLANDNNYPAVIKTMKNTMGSIDVNTYISTENVSLWASDLTQEAYQVLVENKNFYIKELGAVSVQEIEMAAAYNSVKIAIKNKDYTLFNQIQHIFSTYNSPSNEEAFFKISLQFYETLADWDTYAKIACDYLADKQLNNAAYLNNIAWNFYEQINEPELLQKAIEWASQSIQIDNRAYNNDTYASLLSKLEV